MPIENLKSTRGIPHALLVFHNTDLEYGDFFQRMYARCLSNDDDSFANMSSLLI